MTEEKNETADKQEQGDVKGEKESRKQEGKNKRYVQIDLVKLLTYLLIASLLVNAIFIAFFIWGNKTGKFTIRESNNGNVPSIYQVDPYRQTLVSEETYKVGKSDEMHGFKVTVDGIAFRSTETRVYITAENLSNDEVEFMAGAKAVLVDDKQNRYAVDYFGGEHDFWGPIPVNAKVSGWLKFEPVKAGAKTLTFTVPRVFSMQYPAWNVEITFPIPGA